MSVVSTLLRSGHGPAKKGERIVQIRMQPPILNTAIGLTELLNAQFLVHWVIDQWSRDCFRCVVCRSKVVSPPMNKPSSKWIAKEMTYIKGYCVLRTVLLNPTKASGLTISTDPQLVRCLPRKTMVASFTPDKGLMWWYKQKRRLNSYKLCKHWLNHRDND